MACMDTNYRIFCTQLKSRFIHVFFKKLRKQPGLFVGLGITYYAIFLSGLAQSVNSFLPLLTYHIMHGEVYIFIPMLFNLCSLRHFFKRSKFSFPMTPCYKCESNYQTICDQSTWCIKQSIWWIKQQVVQYVKNRLPSSFFR